MNNEEYDSPIAIIGGAARVEHNQELNGNPVKGQHKTRRQFFNGTMRDSETGEDVEVSAFAPVSPYAYKYPLRLDDAPVDWAQIMSLDPQLRMTKGLYMIKYVPQHSKDFRKGRPYKIGQDLIRWDVRVSGPKEWKELCARIPEFGWIDRNSTLRTGLFKIAKQHPGMAFWFTVDWIRYKNKLVKKAKSSSVQIEKPFVARKSSLAEYKEIAKTQDKEVMLRYFNDVLTEVNEVEALPTVQREMIRETGSAYDRSRKVAHDPVTGRFQKKKED